MIERSDTLNQFCVVEPIPPGGIHQVGTITPTILRPSTRMIREGKFTLLFFQFVNQRPARRHSWARMA